MIQPRFKLLFSSFNIMIKAESCLCSWVASKLLPPSLLEGNLSKNRIYDPVKSQTWKQLDGMKFNLSYDNGQIGADGIVGTETVMIGGATAKNFTIGVATNLKADVINTTFDGVLGLGWPFQNTGALMDHLPFLSTFCLANLYSFFLYE